jgi:hypothetical protein
MLSFVICYCGSFRFSISTPRKEGASFSYLKYDPVIFELALYKKIITIMLV